MSATFEKLNPNRSSVNDDFATQQHRRTLRRRQLVGLILLIVVLCALGFGIYRYKLRGMVTRDLAEHLALPPSAPPTELTSFPIRYAGEDLTPRSIAFFADTLYVSFLEQPVVQLYNANLSLLGSWRLQRPDTLFPTQIAVTDSFFVATDRGNDLIGIYDHQGYYVASVAWYPGKTARVSPSQISVNSEQITVVDNKTNYIVAVSLLNDAPFHKFLELLNVTPSPFKPDSAQLSCAFVSSDSNLWLGTSNGRAVILSGSEIQELEKPKMSRIRRPIEFIEVDHAIRSEQHPDPNPVNRIHMLDQVSGKVFVYDLAGNLTLVYPQDRELEQPLSIAVNRERRHIYIAESGRGSITVLGY